jgi:hypothetical protein
MSQDSVGSAKHLEGLSSVDYGLGMSRIVLGLEVTLFCLSTTILVEMAGGRWNGCLQPKLASLSVSLQVSQ